MQLLLSFFASHSCDTFVRLPLHAPSPGRIFFKTVAGFFQDVAGLFWFEVSRQGV